MDEVEGWGDGDYGGMRSFGSVCIIVVWVLWSGLCLLYGDLEMLVEDRWV